jgi:uncharacterized protein
MKNLHKITFLLLIVGGLNWLLLGVFGWEIGSLFGGSSAMLSRLIYVLVGLSAIAEQEMLYGLRRQRRMSKMREKRLCMRQAKFRHGRSAQQSIRRRNADVMLHVYSICLQYPCKSAGIDFLDRVLVYIYPVHMSTGYIISKHPKMPYIRRFLELAKIGGTVFHTGDLANLWHITNKNTLYTTITRYVRQGLLIRIRKGLYTITEPSAIDHLLIGIKAMHGYAYVSTETVLVEQGIMQQDISAITLISDIRKRFSIGAHQYYTRKLPDEFLYQQAGIMVLPNGVRKATVARAVADLLYVNPHAYLDAARLVDWKKVRTLRQELGYPLIRYSYG